jgi:hypothetical protein
MPNVYFYAVRDDCLAIVDFIFGQPGWLLVESASRHDQTNTERLRWGVAILTS